MVKWLTQNDSYVSVVAPISLVSIVVFVIIIVCVVCRRRSSTSKRSSAPVPSQSQRGCSAPTTSSLTTTTYLPAAAPTTSNGLDEYTRCFVAPRRLDGSAVEWTSVPAGASGSPSVTTHGVVGVGNATTSSNARQSLMTAASPAMRSDVRYRFYDEC